MRSRRARPSVSWTAQYRKSLKPIVTEELADLFFYRPAGFLLAKSFERTPLLPNHVTLLSMGCGIATGILFTAGTARTAFAAGILFFLANLLDCTDGQLARLKSVHSEFGRIVDGLGDYVTGTAVFLGMGFGYAHAYYRPGAWWALVVAAGVSFIVQSILIDQHRNRYLALVSGSSQPSDGKAERKAASERFRQSKPRSLRRFALGAYLFYLRLSDRITPAKPRGVRPADRDRLIRRNKPLIRAWTFIGTSTRITVAVVAALFNRLDLFLWAEVCFFNAAAVILAVLQYAADSGERG
jgi:phosphatidylglycerophosphate synthase